MKVFEFRKMNFSVTSKGCGNYVVIVDSAKAIYKFFSNDSYAYDLLSDERECWRKYARRCFWNEFRRKEQVSIISKLFQCV